MLALQRALGNQAVQHLLGGAAVGAERSEGVQSIPDLQGVLTTRAERSVNAVELRGAGHSQSTRALVQREPSEEEKGLLRDRVGGGYQNYRLQTLDNGRELAVGIRDYYLLIRPQGGRRAYWRRYRLQHSGGRGFYGRLVYNPPTLGQVAQTQGEIEAWRAAPLARFRQIDFTAARSLGPRSDNNRVMGQYFLGQNFLGRATPPMPASVYALRQDCEWLHMQGHGLGGQEVATNLYAGSNAANSQMAAVEGAVQVMRDAYGDTIGVRILVSTDDDYHNWDVCDRIAGELHQDAGAVRIAMATKESRMLEAIIYTVTVNGQDVWTESILPFQEGRFDEGQFNQLNERVMYAIQGRQKPMVFVSGGQLPGSGDGSSSDKGGGSGASGSTLMET